MNSPWLSFSGTGSAPRESTQHGILPFSNWYFAYQSMNSRTSVYWPSLRSAAEVSAPSRIQERSYERDPGWIDGPSRLIRIHARFARIVLAICEADVGSLMSTTLRRFSQSARVASSWEEVH